MRFTKKDIALYTLYSNLKFVDIEYPCKKEDAIEITIRRFIEDLESRS